MNRGSVPIASVNGSVANVVVPIRTVFVCEWSSRPLQY